MNTFLKETLVSLADKYEQSSFLEKDPSKFMHFFSKPEDAECAAFIASNLAFGRREQILSHVQMIIDKAGKNLSGWILDKKWADFFPDNDRSFYRMYTNHDMILFFESIHKMLSKSSSLGNYFKQIYENECIKLKQQKEIKKSISLSHTGKPFISLLISSLFPSDCALIPHTQTSAAKKLNMFLRWMVRDNSPVDLGLWTSWYSKEDLLIPLDTHVMQEAGSLNLLAVSASGKTQNPSLKTAILLTDTMRKAFPDDPARGDFALFGLGLDPERNRIIAEIKKMEK